MSDEQKALVASDLLFLLLASESRQQTKCTDAVDRIIQTLGIEQDFKEQFEHYHDRARAKIRKIAEGN